MPSAADRLSICGGHLDAAESLGYGKPRSVATHLLGRRRQAMGWWEEQLENYRSRTGDRVPTVRGRDVAAQADRRSCGAGAASRADGGHAGLLEQRLHRRH
jgi:hypothetical protein